MRGWIPSFISNNVMTRKHCCNPTSSGACSSPWNHKENSLATAHLYKYSRSRRLYGGLPDLADSRNGRNVPTTGKGLQAGGIDPGSRLFSHLDRDAVGRPGLEFLFRLAVPRGGDSLAAK